jgi:hypothetical protein
MALQDRIQSSTVVGEDSSNPVTVIYDDVSGHLQIDYSSYYNRIAASLETLAANSAGIKSSLQTIEEKQTAMESYQKKIKELAEGEGIHFLSPLEYVGFITTYRLLIEEGKILSWRDLQPTDKELSKSLNDLGKYIDKIRQNIPKAF